MNQTTIDNMRKKNNNLDELEVDVDLNNTFWSWNHYIKFNYTKEYCNI